MQVVAKSWEWHSSGGDTVWAQDGSDIVPVLRDPVGRMNFHRDPVTRAQSREA